MPTNTCLVKQEVKRQLRLQWKVAVNRQKGDTVLWDERQHAQLPQLDLS